MKNQTFNLVFKVDNYDLTVLQPILIIILIILIKLTLFISSSRVADGQSGVFNVNVPSPGPYEMSRVQSLQASHATGGVNVSIPVTTAEGTSLSVPIVLNYSSNGVRVDDIASWVGSGWSITLGGVVTRSVRGLADDEAGARGYIYTGHLLYQPYESANDNIWNLVEQENIIGINNTNLRNFVGQYVRGEVDTQPDIYTYSTPFSGGSKFYTPPLNIYDPPPSNLALPGTWSVVQSSHTLNNVLPNGSSRYTGDEIAYWKIFDSFGNEHIYDIVESSLYYSGESVNNIVPQTTSWYLSKLYAPSRADTIIIEYEESRVVNTVGRYQVRTQHLCGSCSVLNNLSPFGLNSSYNWHEYQEKRVSRIVTSKEIIEINYSDRFDHLNYETGMKNISYIAKYVNNSGVRGQKIEEIHFTYDRYGSGSGRYFLRRIEKKSSSESNSIVHEFDYIAPELIPERMNTSQDHWGYFNGATNSPNSMLPSVELEGLAFSAGADRSPSWPEMSYGTLRSIQYPTGGMVLFDYEPHSYSSVLADNSGLYVENESSYELSACVNCVQGSSLAQGVLQVNGDTSAVLSLDINFNLNFQDYYIDNSQFNDINHFVKIYGNGIDLDFVSSDNLSMTINPGNYNVDIQALLPNDGGSSSRFFEATLTARISERTLLQNTNAEGVIAGGVRLKSISYFADSESISHITRYQYAFSDGNKELSSGYIVQRPEYISLYRHLGGASSCLAFKLVSSSDYGMGSVNGSHIGYRKIREYSEDGHIDRFYSSAESHLYSLYYHAPQDIILDLGCSNNLRSQYINSVSHLSRGIGYESVTNASGRNGLLLRSDVFDNSGKLLRRSLNSYSLSPLLFGVASRMGSGVNQTIDISNRARGLSINAHTTFIRYSELSELLSDALVLNYMGFSRYFELLELPLLVEETVVNYN